MLPVGWIKISGDGGKNHGFLGLQFPFLKFCGVCVKMIVENHIKQREKRKRERKRKRC